MKEITSLTIKLFLICAVVATLLAAVNGITAPIIASNEEKTFQLAMEEVLPGCGSFTEVKTDTACSESGVAVSSVYKAEKGGYVISAVCTEGYGGDIQVMVGINPDFTVNQIRIISMSETPGLGAKASTSAFSSQYQGLTAGIKVIKNAVPKDNEIQAISSATITSKAVTKAVNGALEVAEKAKGGDAK